jgi:hypothetical protein
MSAEKETKSTRQSFTFTLLSYIRAEGGYLCVCVRMCNSYNLCTHIQGERENEPNPFFFSKLPYTARISAISDTAR